MTIIYGMAIVFVLVIIIFRVWDNIRTNKILEILKKDSNLTAQDIAFIGDFHLMSLYPLLRALADDGVLVRTEKLWNGRMRIFYKIRK